MSAERDFSKDFIWGTATASYQVEGAAHEDGKGPSIWNAFEKTPGGIVDNVNGDITSNQYHCYPEDIRLMKNAGMNAYRFSIAWSRIFPEGKGKVNPKGLDYYKRLCDGLLENGITPYVTLYHWDLPLALQEQYGGWESRETAKYFADYAAVTVDGLSDRVKHYFTVNEFLGCTDNGYSTGLIAPGLRLDNKRRNQVRHNMLLGHGMALQVLRERVPGAKVGIAENPTFFMPVMDTPEHVDAAKKAFREVNAHFLTAIMEGRYIESYLEAEKENAPVVEDGDFKLIGAPLDFLGLNVYYGKYVRSAPETEKGYVIFDRYNDDSSLLFQPSSMYWGCRIVHELWPQKEIIISENGISGGDHPDKEGKIYDMQRIKYLRGYLSEMARVIREGVPVKGYLHWSLLDNLEWCSGFRPRFGLIFVNYATSERIPKMSYQWYAELIRTGKIQ